MGLFFYSDKRYFGLRLGAQSSYVVKYFEGSNAVKTTSMHNYTTPLFCCTLEGRNRSTKRSTTSHRGWPTAKKLRLGAQSVTLLSTLRDPTQLRRRQCATRQQHSPKKVPVGSRGF